MQNPSQDALRVASEARQWVARLKQLGEVPRTRADLAPLTVQDGANILDLIERLAGSVAALAEVVDRHEVADAINPRGVGGQP